MNSNIFIYEGPGTDQMCINAWKRELSAAVDPSYYTIDSFSPNNLGKLNSSRVALIVVPGGNLIEMLEDFTKIAASVNRLFEEQKTAYLGSCAGALLVSSRLWPNETTYLTKPHMFTDCETGLGFSHVPAIAPCHTPGGLRPLYVEANQTAVEIIMNKKDQEAKRCLLFHAFGPGFMTRNLPPEFTVLDQYVSVTNIKSETEPAATLLHTTSHGRLSLLTGIHPEIGLEDLTLPDLQTQLAQSEAPRKALIGSWLNALNIKTKAPA